MKTIIKLLIVALVLNACMRVGLAAWQYYEFKDAVAQEARFRGEEPVAKLHEYVLRLAEQQGLEVFPADVEIKKNGTQTTIAVAYLDVIELVPRLYAREHLFEFEVSVDAVRPLTPSLR